MYFFELTETLPLYLISLFGIGIASFFFFYKNLIKKNPIIIKKIMIYPIKSCQGIELEKAVMTDYGFMYDREWMLVKQKDAVYKMVTLREYPELYKIKINLINNNLFVILGDKIINLTTVPYKEEIKTEIWGSPCSGYNLGSDISQLFTDFLQSNDKIFLIKIKSHKEMSSNEKYSQLIDSSIQKKRDGANFSDWSPYSLLSVKSVKFINKYHNYSEINEKWYRPNLIVDTNYPFEEETWKTFIINNIRFKSLKKISRCLESTVNPETGKLNKSLEPLKAIKKNHGGYYNFIDKDSRYYKKEGFMGINIIQISDELSEISVGDNIKIEKLKL